MDHERIGYSIDGEVNIHDSTGYLRYQCNQIWDCCTLDDFDYFKSWRTCYDLINFNVSRKLQCGSYTVSAIDVLHYVMSKDDGPRLLRCCRLSRSREEKRRYTEKYVWDQCLHGF